MIEPIIEPAAWVEHLAPPPGGLTRLADAIGAQSRRTHWRRPARWAIGAAAACVIVMSIAQQWPQWQTQRRLAMTIDSQVKAALYGARKDSAATVINGAALEVHSDNPNVRIVWIAQLN